jgi:formate-dependent nitrite reductase membrane component NrfD
MMLAPLLLLAGGARSDLIDIVPGLLALGGIALTGVLLVTDLQRPDRFHYLFTRPQWRSWLAIGAQCINAALLLALAFAAAVLLGWSGLGDTLRWPLVPAGGMLACYTAFLFGQCEGRDLWQSRTLLPHTVVNALVAGAAALGVVALGVGAPPEVHALLAWTIVTGALVSAGLVALDLFVIEHPTEQAARAAHNLFRDVYARRFWFGGVALGLAAPVVLGIAFLLLDGSALLAAAGATALIGMWLYEDAWVRAGQSVPLS